MNTRFRAGLTILGLLSVGDIASLAATDGSHPPYAIAALGAVLGVASLYFLVSAWRNSHGGVRRLLALRIVSALTAMPAFFIHDAPFAATVAAAAVVVLTAVGCFLVAQSNWASVVAR